MSNRHNKSSSHLLQHEIRTLRSNKYNKLTRREAQVRANLEMNMSHYPSPDSIVSPYAMPFIGAGGVRPGSSTKKKDSSYALTGDEVMKRRRRRRLVSTELCFYLTVATD